MSTNDIKINKIESVGLHFAKKSDDLTRNDPKILLKSWQDHSKILKDHGRNLVKYEQHLGGLLAISC